MYRPVGFFSVVLVACVNQHESVTLDPPPEQPVVAIAAPAEPAHEDARADKSRVVIGSCDEKEKGAAFAHFSIIHVNDMQARYSDRIAGKSRYAYVAGFIEAERRKNPNVLVLDAGDDYEKGSLTELRSMGESTRQMIQLLGVDVRTIGNHDFAYGESAVVRDVTLSRHPVLAANVHRKDGTSEFLPYVEVDVGCAKVGVVGLVTQNYGADDQPTKQAFCDVWEHDDHYAQALAREVQKHRGEVDAIIALNHTGLYEDIGLAQVVPGVDLIVGGHTEDLLKEARPAIHQDGTITWVAQAGHYGEEIGTADVVVGKRDHAFGIEHYKMIDVNEKLPVDEDVALRVEKLERKFTPGLMTPIATLSHDVKTQKEMADLLYAATVREWGADALLVGKDAFWGGLAEGPVTLQHLYDETYVQREPTGTSGFTSLHVMELTGRELLLLREQFIQGPLFEFYMRDDVKLDRTYRVVIEKRALTYPHLAFRDSHLPKARFAGEVIDVLEAYARDRTKRGLPLN